MQIKKIAILGGGNGGFAAAADLSSRDFLVNFFELPRFEDNILDAAKKGGIEINEAGKKQFVRVNKITTDIKKAVNDVDLIILIVPAYAVEEFAYHCIPHLKDGQKIVINGAASLGALRFSRAVKKLAPDLGIKVAETASLTYASRREGTSGVNILLFVQNIFFSAFPAINTQEMLKTFQCLYPSVIEAKNILETTLNNGNAVGHPASSILNAGRLDSKGEFCIYTEGTSPSVARVIEAVDQERLALCKVLGFKEIATRDRIVRYGYAKSAGTLYEELVGSNILSQARGSFDINNRYLTEDIPYGLVLLSSLGASLGIPTPTTDALIRIGSVLCNRDFRAEGLTLEKLGLDGLNGNQLNYYMTTGNK